MLFRAVIAQRATAWAPAAILVVLAAAVIAGQSGEAARRREPEVALARLRGLHGVRLAWFAAGGQLVVILAGSLLGLAVGDATVHYAPRSWFSPAQSFRLGGDECVAAGVVFGIAALAVLSASGGPLRRPLAAGELVGWLQRPTARSRRIGWFLTVRRLSRRGKSVAVLRTVVSAGVVLGVSLPAVSAASGWRQERARLQPGGPVAYRVRDGVVAAYAAALRADPRGHWLMPAAAFNGSDLGGRRVYVDVARWDRVDSAFFAGTPAASGASAAAQLAGGRLAGGATPPVASGATLAVTLQVAPLAHMLGAPTNRVVVRYVDAAGELATAQAMVPRDVSGGGGARGLLTLWQRVRGCAVGCLVSSIAYTGFSHGELAVESVRFGDLSLLSARLDGHVADDRHLTARRSGHGVVLDAPYGVGAGIPATRAFVIARPDTPGSVLAALRGTGVVGPAQDYRSALRALGTAPAAQEMRLYEAVGIGAGLIALVFAIASAVAQVRDRRREAASLRVVGVSAGQVRAAYWGESVVLFAAAFVGTAVASWAACRGLLSRLPLVSGWAYAPPLDSSPRPALILAVSVALGVVLGAVSLAAFWRVGAQAAPQTLREDG